MDWALYCGITLPNNGMRPEMWQMLRHAKVPGQPSVALDYGMPLIEGRCFFCLRFFAARLFTGRILFSAVRSAFPVNPLDRSAGRTD